MVFHVFCVFRAGQGASPEPRARGDVCARDAHPHVAVPAIGVAKPGTTVRLRSSGAEPGHDCRVAPPAPCTGQAAAETAAEIYLPSRRCSLSKSLGQCQPGAPPAGSST